MYSGILLCILCSAVRGKVHLEDVKNTAFALWGKRQKNQKACSICGVVYASGEFAYGNKENRSYCRKCDKVEKAAYALGGADGARRYREEPRSKWKG